MLAGSGKRPDAGGVGVLTVGLPADLFNRSLSKENLRCSPSFPLFLPGRSRGGFAAPCAPGLPGQAGGRFTGLAQPAIQFVLVFRVIHGELENLDPSRTRGLL